jgi:hypothetical protein
MVEIHHVGHVRSEDDPAWLIGRTVELLMPRVERNGEQRALFPFDGMLGFILLPYGRRAFTAHHIHDGIIDVALGLELSLGRDLYDLQTVILLVSQAGVSDFSASSFPIGQGQRRKIFERAAFIKRRSFLLDKFLIGAFDVPFIKSCRLLRHHSTPM